MKRYTLYAGIYHGYRISWDNFHGYFDTVEQARGRIRELREGRHALSWFRVVDNKTGKTEHKET